MPLWERVAARLRALLSADTDQALVRARASGETLVAVTRLGLVLAFCAITLLNLSPGTRHLETAVAAGALAYGISLLVMSRVVRGAWLSWATTSIDVSLITVSLALFALAGDPLGAINNRPFFETYFFVLVNTALRYDWRLCAFATILILAQFMGMVSWIDARWDLATYRDVTGARFLPFIHSLRLVLLASVGLSTVVVARWARHLRLMVGTDHLTGLSQRRPFLERIDEELARSNSSRASLSVALLDVDLFKKFNDSHGHLAGDRALQLLAGRIRKSVRSSDLVARFGGEEFVIAFPRMDVDRAVRRVNELRAELAKIPIPVSGNTYFLTLSAGVGSWPADGESFEAVLAKVDERLYDAKRQGRDQSVGPKELLRAVDG